jgi:hypothetical protein
MEHLKEKTVDLADHVEDFADTFYKLTVIKATEKATNVTAGVLAVAVVAILGLFVIMFGGIALCWWLGNLVNSRALGFLLGAVFFLIVMVVIVMLRKQIVFPYIRDLILRKAHE